MKKLLTLFLLLTSLTLFSQEIPNKFELVEDVISIGTDFELSVVNGTIDQEIVSIGSNFTLKINGIIVSESKQRLISIGSKIDIFDGDGNKIGMIEEKIFESMFSMYSSYIIYNKDGDKIANSIKHKMMVTKFNIRDMNGDVVATIKKDVINFFSDTWTFDFKNTEFDKRLLIFIPVYKTYRDNKKKK